MSVKETRDVVHGALAENDGILGLEPAWVARDWLPPGRRLGLSEEEYDLGERGYLQSSGQEEANPVLPRRARDLRYRRFPQAPHEPRHGFP